ncbi:MAG: CBS domain-containing protein, partial [Nitrososphaerales archaeon]
MSNSDMGTVLNTSIQSIMDLDVVVLDGNNSVSDAVEKMKEKNSRSVLVTHTGEIIGLVSKTDILFKVMGRGKDPTKAKLREIMSSPVLTIPPSSTVGEALSIMDKNTVRQLVVSFGNSIM